MYFLFYFNQCFKNLLLFHNYVFVFARSSILNKWLNIVLYCIPNKYINVITNTLNVKCGKYQYTLISHLISNNHTQITTQKCPIEHNRMALCLYLMMSLKKVLK